jgi:hypothetical protein
MKWFSFTIKLLSFRNFNLGRVNAVHCIMNNNVEFIEVIIRLGYNFCCFFMFLSSIGKSRGGSKYLGGEQ